MTALVLMCGEGGWSVFCDGARMNPPLSREVALELAFRLALQAARKGGAVSMVVDEDPEGVSTFSFHMEPEPAMYFRPREARTFADDEPIIPPARSTTA